MITVWDEGTVAVVSATDPFDVTVIHRVSEPGVLEQYLTRVSRALLTPNGRPDFRAVVRGLPVVRYGVREDDLLVVTRDGDVLRLKQVSGWGWFNDTTIEQLSAILGQLGKPAAQTLSERLSLEFETELLASIDADGRFKIASPRRKLTQDEKERIKTAYMRWKSEQK